MSQFSSILKISSGSRAACLVNALVRDLRSAHGGSGFGHKWSRGPLSLSLSEELKSSLLYSDSGVGGAVFTFGGCFAFGVTCCLGATALGLGVDGGGICSAESFLGDSGGFCDTGAKAEAVGITAVF